MVAEEWEERIGAVTSTVLGLTVACARCHDHKFDPITTHDYYALAGVLASTRQADRPVIPLDMRSVMVETPSDFGAQGARPTHPELLDDLAARFMANGWSLKWLHREIVLSAAYRQQSALSSQHSVDPGNRLLSRMNRRRLEIEAWRDAMLAVSGTLRAEVGGPPLDLGNANNHRRTLYGTVKRRELSDLLRLHDFPDPTTHSAARVPTTTPLQQLFVLNSPFIQQQAAALARRVKSAEGIEARVQRLYRLLYGRPATEAQVRLAVEFLTPESETGWQQYCQALLRSNEFLFVD